MTRLPLDANPRLFQHPYYHHDQHKRDVSGFPCTARFASAAISSSAYSSALSRQSSRQISDAVFKRAISAWVPIYRVRASDRAAPYCTRAFITCGCGTDHCDA